jgi:hypothetical protein
MNWKLSQDGLSAYRALDNGGVESRLISAIDPSEVVLPADPFPNPQLGIIDAQLAALDIKRIRPIAEGDSVYLATLNIQATALRAQRALLPTTV